MGGVGHLVREPGAPGAAAVGPAVHSGFEEEAVDDELTTPLEQVEQAHRPIRAIELVGLLDRHPRHPPPLGRERVVGVRQRLLIDE